MTAFLPTTITNHDHGFSVVARYNSAKAPSITSADLRRGIVHHLHLLQQRPDKLAANS